MAGVIRNVLTRCTCLDVKQCVSVCMSKNLMIFSAVVLVVIVEKNRRGTAAMENVICSDVGLVKLNHWFTVVLLRKRGGCDSWPLKNSMRFPTKFITKYCRCVQTKITG